MQLTSTTDAQASRQPGASSVAGRLNHPAAASVIAFLAWLGFVLARWQVWAAGHITLFVGAGHIYSQPANILHVPSKGYDGQFYYRFALDPFDWNKTAFGITIDYTYRYTRIGYPLLTWIVAGGQHGAVPWALVAVNVVFVAVIAWLGAVLAKQAGRHALWGLLFAGYFGLVISVGRDTSEPLADACMLAALISYRRSRYVLAAVLLAYGVITNEPILALAVGIALTRFYSMWKQRRIRFGGEDLIWVVPAAAYLVLQGVEHVVVKGAGGGSGGLSDVTQNFAAPFSAMVPAIYEDFRQMSWTHLGLFDFNLIELIVLLIVLVSGLLVLRSTLAPVHERVGFVLFVLIELVFASWQFWGSVFADGRTYVDAFLMALVLLIATPSARAAGAAEEPGAAEADSTAEDQRGVLARLFTDRRVVTSERLAWIAAAMGVVLILVVRRRILFQ